jgi:hypothetical protein
MKECETIPSQNEMASYTLQYLSRNKQFANKDVHGHDHEKRKD